MSPCCLTGQSARRRCARTLCCAPNGRSVPAAQRDPLSYRYDGYVRQVMLRAIRAERQAQGVAVWIASPRGDFVDARGLTAHERAFQRACYYLAFRVYMNQKPRRVPPYALKMRWTDETRPSSNGRTARRVTLRLFLRSKARKPPGPGWGATPSQRSVWLGGGEHQVPPP